MAIEAIGSWAVSRELPAALTMARPGMLTLLEAGLPIRELSLLAAADRRSIDPVYGAHRWWARRPPAIMRGIVLAAALSADAPIYKFWSAFASPK